MNKSVLLMALLEWGGASHFKGVFRWWNVMRLYLALQEGTKIICNRQHLRVFQSMMLDAAVKRVRPDLNPEHDMHPLILEDVRFTLWPDGKRVLIHAAYDRELAHAIRDHLNLKQLPLVSTVMFSLPEATTPDKLRLALCDYSNPFYSLYHECLVASLERWQ